MPRSPAGNGRRVQQGVWRRSRPPDLSLSSKSEYMIRRLIDEPRIGNVRTTGIYAMSS